MIDKIILKTANGKFPNGFSQFPDFSINKSQDGEYSLLTTLETDSKDLLPIGAKDKDLTIAVIKLYKFAHSLNTKK